MNTPTKLIATFAIAMVGLICNPSSTQTVEDNPFNNFVASAALDTTQVIEAVPAELICYNTPNVYGDWSCYEPTRVDREIAASNDYQPVWVGSKSDYATILREASK